VGSSAPKQSGGTGTGAADGQPAASDGQPAASDGQPAASDEPAGDETA
jgi:hypothetical protein